MSEALLFEGNSLIEADAPKLSASLGRLILKGLCQRYLARPLLRRPLVLSGVQLGPKPRIQGTLLSFAKADSFPPTALIEKEMEEYTSMCSSSALSVDVSNIMFSCNGLRLGTCIRKARTHLICAVVLSIISTPHQPGAPLTKRVILV